MSCEAFIKYGPKMGKNVIIKQKMEINIVENIKIMMLTKI